MELKIWSPFSDLERAWRFDLPRFFGEPGFGFRPSIDVIRGDDELTITAELPGVDPDDVDVTLDGDMLVIKGEKSEEQEIDEDDRYVHERSYGSFLRRIPLPDGVDAKAISASFEHGVLTVEVALPEVKASEPRKIKVTAKT